MRIDEILHSSTDEEIPDIVYHGTTLENAKEILKHGLDPKRSQLSDEYELEDGGPFVWLGWNEKSSRNFAPGGRHFPKTNEQGAILEIRLPEEIAKQCRTDIGEFLRCTVHIPPQYIKLLKLTNVPEERTGKLTPNK
jgi:hypothetical protein